MIATVIIIILIINIIPGFIFLESLSDQENDYKSDPTDKVRYLKNMKYILQWTPSDQEPFTVLGTGTSAFERNSCRYTNCFVTNIRSMFTDIRYFDAIAFHGKDLTIMHTDYLPPVRSQQQKYIFATTESAHYYPICDHLYDGYFNWTWTYRLDSDVRWGYVTVFDLKGKQIGPKDNMSWPTTYLPINDELRKKLRSKTKAAAWFVSNCDTKSDRRYFAKGLRNELRHYNMTVDFYGKCFKLKCPKRKSKSCNKMLERNYYFYFAFENSFDKDYVTEKLLTALNNLCVPVVYGGADYTRFMPPGSYLNGYEEVDLATTMRDIINNRTRYEDMFRWRNHYQYIETTYIEDVCKLCAKLNDAQELSRETVWDQFRDWWNTDPSWCDGWTPPTYKALAPSPYNSHHSLLRVCCIVYTTFCLYEL